MANKGCGWTILAAALTNTPRARQKDNPISIVERNGEEYLKVPLIKKCKIRYRGEILTFGQDEFDQMLTNHKNQVWDAPPYIRVGHYDNPGLAWFAQVGDQSPSGEMVQEGDWLVAYALPTDEKVREAERGYKYSSIDVHPDYSSNQMGLAFNSSKFEEVDEVEVTEEETMSGDGKNKKVVELSQEEYQDLLAEGSKERAELQRELDEVKELKAQLEANQAKAKRQVYFSSVSAVIDRAKARRSEDGKSALPAFILNTVEAILKFEVIESGSGVIKLDREGGESGLVDYVFHAIDHLLTNMPIISMSIEGSSEHKEDARYEGDDGKETISFGLETIPLDEFYENEAHLALGVKPAEVTQ